MNFKNLKLKFVGPRLYLRTLDEADATEEYCGWLNDPEVNRFLATKSATIPSLRSWIREKNESSGALFFGMFVNENNKFIGTIKLDNFDFASGKATIATMIGDKNYWGKGLNGEAMKLLIDYCFDKLGLYEVNLGVIGENSSAMRSYEKLGFREVARDRKAVKYNDILYDQVTMVLSKNI